MAYERIKTEHAGAKNGGGGWMTRTEAKQTARHQRRRADQTEAQGEGGEVEDHWATANAREGALACLGWRLPTMSDGAAKPTTTVTMMGMAHATGADKSAVERRAAIERTRGMFAHLAPGVSLADELIADRRAEARAEDPQEAQRRRRRGAS